MPSRLLLVPIVISTRRGDDGRPVEVHTPDFFGFTPERFTVKSDYRDCAKVLVTLADKPLRDLETKAREHFAQLWRRPEAPPDDL